MKKFLVLGNDTDRTGRHLGQGTTTRCEVAVRSVCSYLTDHPQTGEVVIYLAPGKGGRWKGKDTMAKAMGHLVTNRLGDYRVKSCSVIVNSGIDSIWGSYYELLWAFNKLRDQRSTGKSQEENTLTIVTNRVHAKRVKYIKNHFFQSEPDIDFVYSDEAPPSWLHERLAYLKLVAHMVGLGPVAEAFRRKYLN